MALFKFDLQNEDRLPRIEFKHSISFPGFKQPEVKDEREVLFLRAEMIPDANGHVIIYQARSTRAVMISSEAPTRTGRASDLSTFPENITGEWFFYHFSDGNTVFCSQSLAIRIAANFPS